MDNFELYMIDRIKEYADMYREGEAKGADTNISMNITTELICALSRYEDNKNC